MAKKDNPDHINEIRSIGVSSIDLVVVNLYPFEKILNDPKSNNEDCIENIDIGGPSMIRAAAKNFQSVAVLSSPEQYKNFINEATKNNNKISLKTRKILSSLPSNQQLTDSIISNWFSKNDELFKSSFSSIPIKKLTI